MLQFVDAVQLAARPYVPSAQSCLYTMSIYHVATAYPGFEPRPGQLSWPKTRLAFLGFLLLLFLFFFVFCLQHTTKIASPFMGASSWLDLALVASVGSLIQLAFYLSPLSTGKASRTNYPHCPHPAQPPLHTYAHPSGLTATSCYCYCPCPCHGSVGPQQWAIIVGAPHCN